MTDAAATWTPIGTIKPWDKNPRRNEAAVDEVAKSIKRFGFGAPILARTQDRVVIAGHTRLKAAVKLGLDKVPVRFLDLDPAMARALALADNKLAELAQWDEEGLADVLRELATAEVDFDGLGFTDTELEAFLNTAALPDAWRAFDDSIGEEASAEKSVTCPHCGEVFTA